ncbi:MAG: alpha/beta hydrolase [Megasphaera sp.]|jgi:alpha-beta hydrolase superfamily lysophospholipase|nr:alpha/beta hydrolase [Megasphaera sp.]
MEKKFQINEDGMSIHCKLLTKDSDTHTRTFSHIVLVTHGFGSSKDTAGTVHFAEHLTGKYKGYGVIAFDWPCHGEDARKKLTIDECLSYVTHVITYAKKEFQAKTIDMYATSFGAYIILRYILTIGNPFHKIAMRSPGINMYETMSHHIGEEGLRLLKKGKDIQIGFDRKMKIDRSFLQDLKEFNVMDKEYFEYADDMLILHGTNDDMIPISISQEFAENNVIEFIPIEGANHPFQNPNHMALAIHHIIEFFHA